ncbi:protein phosphatase 1 regulatory subunit 12A isoform X2 [Hemibagrus wyckioides]|uniref:protein phosphatase 1 regulatory subunit 12A isoform X2 n=1 Tax=Hemibagrus wyckioides TaxID=337641 RepID=UPI00266B83F6|nr:protein phosphatase 1 regulatory subunit 12A isoform X2 [Hemibagrus wyckioides]
MLDSSDRGKTEATTLSDMSSYLRNKDLSSRTRKSVLESPTFSPFSGNRSFKHDRSRGDASEVESASETLGNTSYYTRRELDSLNKTTDFASKDYKKVTEYTWGKSNRQCLKIPKLYEEALAENEKLKACLEDSKQDLAKLRLQLDKITQKQDRISERSSVSESEKMEKQLLEKRVTEMEEDIKISSDFHQKIIILRRD